MPVRLIECEHLGEVLARIGADHVRDRWLYRGQTFRRGPHHITEGNQAFEFENLYPQSFRFAADHAGFSEDFTERWQKEYARVESLFHAFNLFLISKYEAGRESDSGRFRWMDPYADELRRLFHGAGPSVFSEFHEKGLGLKNPEFIRLSWSLAQHYGVVTALLDLTFDPDVAVWFATNHWDPPPRSQSLIGTGVIYRFDVASLLAGIHTVNSMESESAANIYKAPAGKAFLQDLRELPAAFALRPQRQGAAVVSGFDDLLFVRLFNGAGEFDAFVFSHRADQLSRWPLELSREDLISSDDPFRELKDEFDSKWRPISDAFKVKYTKPVVVLTNDGPKFANIPDEVADAQREAERDQLYEFGMALLGSDLEAAEDKFQTVIGMARQDEADRQSSHAYARIAVIRLLRGDFPGTAAALESSLEGPERRPDESWVGQLLLTLAQGAQELHRKGEGVLALRVAKKLAAVAARGGPDPQVLEAELGAMMMAGTLELEQGNSQSGFALLGYVAERPLVGLTPHQRSLVAAALQGIAEANDALGDENRARSSYKDIEERFADDELPGTVRAVARARAWLARRK